MSQQVWSVKTEEIGGKNVQLCSSSLGLVFMCSQDDRVQVGGNQQQLVEYYKHL